MKNTLILISAMFFWGANWTSAKILTPFISAPGLIVARLGILSLLFIPLLLVKKTGFKLTRKDTLFMAISSAIMGIYQFFFFKGLATGLAGSGGVLVTTTSPIFTFILISMIAKKKLSLRENIGLLIGFISAVFFLELWAFNVSQLIRSGTFYFLLASLAWAALTVLREQIKAQSLLYSFYLTLPLPFVFALGVPASEWQQITTLGPVFWGNIVYMATFGTLYSTTAYFYATKTLGAKTSSSFVFLVPLFAVMTAILVLHEPISWETWVAGPAALVSVYILNTKKQPAIKE